MWDFFIVILPRQKNHHAERQACNGYSPIIVLTLLYSEFSIQLTIVLLDT